MFSTQSITSTCQIGDLKAVFGYIPVNVNGAKRPNVIGKDIFSAWITSNGLIPEGSGVKNRLSTC